MTDEATGAAAVGTTATLTSLIEIRYGISYLTPTGVIDKINEFIYLPVHNKQIELVMFFPRRHTITDEVYELFRFDATVAMQNKIVESSRYIKKIKMHNFCNEKEEHDRCFNFFTRITQGIIGNGKHLAYLSRQFKFEVEQADQLARALLQSNNNNTGAIERFDFIHFNVKPVTLQSVWDALLDSGVRNITFENDYDYDYDDGDADPPINDNNNSINFMGLETNTSLKELDLSDFCMLEEEDFRSLFHSIKKNKGLQKLVLSCWDYKDLPKEVKKLFEEMMCENITLLYCSLVHVDENVPDRNFEVIQFHMKLNRMWKRYIMKREKEKKTPAVITRREERDNNNNNNNEEEKERKKRLKMRLLFRVFHQKTVLRDTILFHLLSEYPDDLMDTDDFQNR